MKQTIQNLHRSARPWAALATIAFIALAVLLSAPPAQAANGSWNVNASSTWITAGNWTPGIPGNNASDNTDVATFSFTLASSGKTVTVDTTRFIGGISFGNTATLGYTLSSGALRLNSGGVIQTLSGNGNHTDTISTPIQISGTSAGAATFTAGASSATSLLSIGAVTGSATAGNTTTLTLGGANTGNNTITGIIGDGSGGGTLAITKSGAGKWQLSGVNTYSGGTTISAGTLTRAAANVMPDTGTVTVDGTAVLSGSFSDTIQNLTINSTSASTLSGLNITGTLNITAAASHGIGSSASATAATMSMSGTSTLLLSANGGDSTLNIGSGGLTMSGATLQFGAQGNYPNIAKVALGGDFTGSGANQFSLGIGYSINQVDLGNATRTFNISSGTTTIAPVVQNGGLTKSGVGTLTLSGANTYSGDTTISAGTLALTSSGSIANSPNILLAGGATFDVSGRTTEFTLGNAQTLKATGTASAGTITMASGKGVAMGADSGLQFTAYDGANAPLTVSGTGGSLTLAAGNVVTVTPTSQLGLGSYKLVSKSGSATVAGTAPSSVTVNSPGTAANTGGFLSISDGELYLVVTNAYAVTYNANGATSGSVPVAQTKVKDVPLTLASNTGNLATNGLAFAGWNTQADGNGTTYAEGATYTANAAVILYAKWTSGSTYAITYNGNGNTSGSAPGNQTKVQNVTLTLASNSGNLAKTGYTLAGWTNDLGADYALGGSYTANAAATLYAKWTINSYTVTYNGNTSDSGDVPVDGSSPYNYNSTVTVLGNTSNLGKAGYAFAGWNTAANGLGTSYAPAATFNIAANTTLYAQWAPQLYWDNTGGTADDWAGVANWSTVVGGGTDPGAIPGASDWATFSATPIQGTAQTVNLNADRSVLGLNVLSAVTATTTLLGGDTDRTLTLGASGIVNAGSGQVTIGSSTAGQRVTNMLAGSQSWANNGTGLLLINNTVSGSGSPTLTNNGTGSGAVQVGGVIASSVIKVVQDSATSELSLRNAANAFSILEVKKGTVATGNGDNALGVTWATLGNGTDSASIYHDDNANAIYTTTFNLAAGATGTLTIGIRGNGAGTYTATHTDGTTGTGNLTLDNNGGDEKLTFTTDPINHAGTITHIGAGTGDLTIGGQIETKVTGVIQNSATSRMVITSSANTYTGDTTISAGTLRLTGTIASTPNIIVASGATFDLSARGSALTLGGGQTLKASATGDNTTASITVASSKNLTLGGTTTGVAFTAYGGGATAPLTVGGTGGSLVLNSKPVTVTTTTALAPGTYKLIAKSGSATVSGTPGTLTVNGSGTAANTVGSLSVSSGELFLVVAATTSLYWDNTGGTGNDWSSLPNWSTVVGGGTDPAAVPGASAVANFSATPIQGTAQTVNLNADRSVAGVNVLSGVTATTTLQGGNANRTLTVNGAGIVNNSSQALTIGSGTANQNVPVTLAGSQSIAANGSGGITFNNNVASSTVSPTLTNNGSGSGVVKFAGTVGNTVTKVVQDSATSILSLRNSANAFANLEIKKGTVEMASGGNVLGTGAVTLGNGTDPASLFHQDNGTASYANSINLATGAGTLTIGIRDDTPSAYTATFTGGVTGNNSLTLDNNGGDEKLTFSTGALNNAGTITHIGAGTGDLTINSIIGANVTGVIQNSANSRMVLGGNNSYTGPTTVSAGTLQVGGSLAAGSAVTVDSAGTLSGTGTVAGPVTVNGTLKAGTSVGQLTVGALALNDGGTNEMEVINAAGAPGTGYDTVVVTNNIGIPASGTFTIKLLSLNGSGAAGSVTNFSYDTSYVWTNALGTLTNAGAIANVIVNDSAFSNDLAGGVFSVEAGSLNVKFTRNHAPTAGAVNYSFARGVSVKPFNIPIATFLANNTEDADGDARTLVSLTSTNATVSTNVSPGNITLSSTNGLAESIAYVVQDVRNYRVGDTVRYATNYINILRTNSVGTVTVSNLGGTNMTVSFYGIPSYQYVIQRSCNDLNSWADLVTNPAAANGLLQYTETPPPGCNPAFYRVRSE